MGESPIIGRRWLEWKIGFQCKGMQIEKISSISRKIETRGMSTAGDSNNEICLTTSRLIPEDNLRSVYGRLILIDLHSRDNALAA